MFISLSVCFHFHKQQDQMESEMKGLILIRLICILQKYHSHNDHNTKVIFNSKIPGRFTTTGSHLIPLNGTNKEDILQLYCLMKWRFPPPSYTWAAPLYGRNLNKGEMLSWPIFCGRCCCDLFSATFPVGGRSKDRGTVRVITQHLPQFHNLLFIPTKSKIIFV